MSTWWRSRRSFVGFAVACCSLASLTLIVLGCNLALPRAGQPTQRHRIGYIAPGTVSSTTESLNALRDGLNDYGYVEGVNTDLEGALRGGQGGALRPTCR